MSVDNAGARLSKKSVWAGRILSGLLVLFLIPDGIVKFIRPAPVLEAFAHLGWPVSLANTLGILLLTCTALYAFPRTSILGAILLTGYLGGAVATHFARAIHSSAMFCFRFIWVRCFGSDCTCETTGCAYWFLCEARQIAGNACPFLSFAIARSEAMPDLTYALGTGPGAH